MENENFVKINLKKSSSKEGRMGYDIEVKANENADEKMLEKLAEMSIKTALKTQKILYERGF